MIEQQRLFQKLREHQGKQEAKTFDGKTIVYDTDFRTGEANILLGSIFYLSRRLTESPLVQEPWICESNEQKIAHHAKKLPKLPKLRRTLLEELQLDLGACAFCRQIRPLP